MTNSNYTYPCPRCQVGHCQRSTTPYLKVHGDMLVTVPDMPLWTCDICGYYEYERDVLTRLETLMTSPARHARRTKVQTNRTSRRVKP